MKRAYRERRGSDSRRVNPALPQPILQIQLANIHTPTPHHFPTVKLKVNSTKQHAVDQRSACHINSPLQLGIITLFYMIVIGILEIFPPRTFANEHLTIV